MKQNSLDINIARKFTRLYILALTAVAFLSILGQLLVQRSLDKQLNDSWIINYAGRQRFQSQEIVKNILILSDRKDKTNPDAYLLDLNRVLASWEKYHYQLKNGDLKELGVAMSNSDTINKMFASIDPAFLTILKNAKKVRYMTEHPDQSKPEELEKSIKAILANEMIFLNGMDRIVFQYDFEAKSKVRALRRTELLLLCFTLFVLLLEGMFVFRPAVKHLRLTILRLVDSEANAQNMNEELISLNQSLQKAEQDLLAITSQKYQQKITEQKMRAAYLIEGQEEERKRLAREIHDGLGQMLTALKLSVENISGLGDFSEKAQRPIADLKAMISQTIGEVRTISFNLMPAVLSDFGIASALKLLADQNSKTSGVNINFHSDWNAERIDKKTEIGLYRIAQEAINNAIKYSQASEISIGLASNSKYIRLYIVDNGRGFEYNRIKQDIEKASLSNGINNMKVRTNMIDGLLKLTSHPGKGTKIFIKVPLKKKYQPHEHEKDKGIAG